MNAFRIALMISLVTASGAAADEVYKEPTVFLTEAFNGNVPPAEVLWITGERRDATRRILGHAPRMLRVRYWARNDRTAWLLEEIGKYRPITAGFVINNGRIEGAAVLIYRESIGWEVRHRFFLDQFERARLTEELRLTKPVDGISGATLSVRAVTGLARLALYLHSEAMNER